LHSLLQLGDRKRIEAGGTTECRECLLESARGAERLVADQLEESSGAAGALGAIAGRERFGEPATLAVDPGKIGKGVGAPDRVAKPLDDLQDPAHVKLGLFQPA